MKEKCSKKSWDKKDKVNSKRRRNFNQRDKLIGVRGLKEVTEDKNLLTKSLLSKSGFRKVKPHQNKNQGNTMDLVVVEAVVEVGTEAKEEEAAEEVEAEGMLTITKETTQTVILITLQVIL